MKNILKSIGYLIFYIFLQGFITSLSPIFGGAEAMKNPQKFIGDNMILIASIANLVSVFALYLFFLIRKKKISVEINLKKVSAKSCVLPCVIAFSYSMSAFLFVYNVQFGNAEQMTQSVAHFNETAPFLGEILKVLALLVVAPITEEIIFRGLILTRLQRNFSEMTAVIMSGVLFGLIHIMAGGPLLVLIATLMGIILGFIAVKTKSLLPAILAHIAANLTDFILSAMPGLSNAVLYALAALFAVIFILCVSAFIKKEKA